MIRNKLRVIIGLILLGTVLLQSCGGGAVEPTPRPKTSAPTSEPVASTPDQPVAQPDGYTEVTVTNGGGIRGIITLKGAPPSQGTITVTKDNDVFGNTIPDETLIVSADGNVKNAFVFIVEIDQGKALPKTLPILNNEGGRFVPHAQVFPQREFLIVNSDPVLHNTHPYLGLKGEGGRSLYNIAMSKQGKEVRRPLRNGGLYQIRCDAHDWMRSYVWVLDHPYGEISGEDGAYTITDIPAGTYKLMAWHEEMGEQEVEVIVPAGGTVEVNFEFTQ